MISLRKKSRGRAPFFKRGWFVVAAGSVVTLILVAAIAFRVSPWPGALIIRAAFNQGGGKTLAAMRAALPSYPVTVVHNQAYRPGDNAAHLDVYMPTKVVGTSTTLPVVIWTHGGGWLSGDKKDAAPYYSRLADQGFVVVSLDYSLAPNKAYPFAVHELNDAQAYVVANAARLHINPGKIVLAGDSAGAQLSSQLAVIITNPAYAKEVGVQPSLKPSQLAGVMLFCGIYKMEGLAEPSTTLPKIIGWGEDVTVWAYTGTRDKTSPLIRQMSAYYHVTKAFPPTFITGGNGDPLTSAQSVPFANELTSLGVPVTTLFYAKDHMPSLPHEYQFTFNTDGQNAFAQAVAFLRAKM